MSTPKIDAHLHINRWRANDGTPVFDSVRRYLRESSFDSIDNMCCSNNANLWDGYERDQNILAAVVKLEIPETYAHGCMMIPTPEEEAADPARFDFVEQLEMLTAMGFDGIKFCEFKPDSYKIHQMDERLESFEPYFAYCEKHHVPMCWHIADPEEFWDAEKVPHVAIEAGWFYGNGTFPAQEDLYRKTYAILDRHPNLTVVLAHAFFLSNKPAEARALFRKYPNVSIDLAPGWEMFDGFRTHYDDWAEIFRTHADRILIATDAEVSGGGDFPLTIDERVTGFLTNTDTVELPWGYTIRGIALEEPHRSKIFAENCRRIVGETPKPIDRAVLKEYIKRYLPIIPPSENTAALEEYYRKNLL